jgi:acetoacetyl-CoA reductase/3-oxoacyl-[acyl-carrier protein] reductase
MKTALITGGSRGLGRGIVIAMAKAGYKVIFTYNKDEASAKKVLKECETFDGFVEAMQMEVGDAIATRNNVKNLFNSFGIVDILVNNAGIAQEKPFETISDEDWNNMLNVNLRGPFSLIQELIPRMVDRKWGRIINISSIGGQWGGFNQVHYAAAKAGLINLTQSIAKIYSKDGITSNAIAPGLVSTDMASAELNSKAGKDKVKGIPARRLGTVEEIGAAVVFLSSDDSSYITGQTVNLNGGMFFST